MNFESGLGAGGRFFQDSKIGGNMGIGFRIGKKEEDLSYLLVFKEAGAFLADPGSVFIGQEFIVIGDRGPGIDQSEFSRQDREGNFMPAGQLRYFLYPFRTVAFDRRHQCGLCAFPPAADGDNQYFLPVFHRKNFIIKVALVR